MTEDEEFVVLDTRDWASHLTLLAHVLIPQERHQLTCRLGLYWDRGREVLLLKKLLLRGTKEVPSYYLPVRENLATFSVGEFHALQQLIAPREGLHARIAEAQLQEKELVGEDIDF